MFSFESYSNAFCKLFCKILVFFPAAQYFMLTKLAMLYVFFSLPLSNLLPLHRPFPRWSKTDIGWFTRETRKEYSRATCKSYNLQLTVSREKALAAGDDGCKILEPFLNSTGPQGLRLSLSLLECLTVAPHFPRCGFRIWKEQWKEGEGGRKKLPERRATGWEIMDFERDWKIE